MNKGRSKIIIACAISVVVTFLLSSVLYVCIGMTIFNKTMLGDEGSAVLTELKAYIDALYLEEYDERELYEMAAKGMTYALDDYTSYYTTEEFEDFILATRGSYVGVGLGLTMNAEGQIIVVKAYEECPGAEAGVLAGDILVSVDGVAHEDLDAAAQALRGDGSEKQGAGSVVETVFLRDGVEKKFTITRREVHIKTVTSRIENGDVGYVNIASFDEDTDAEFKTQYEALKAEGIKSLVIDLRDNGGGDFYTACNIAGMFLEEGATVVYRMDKSGERSYEYAKGHCIDLPVVILANGNSASASEVLIGALKGNDRLKALVGTKTFGKGITQHVFPLASGGGLSITVDRYYTADDRCIHGTGFAPDVLVESGFEEDYPIEAIERAQDVQLDKALEAVSK